MMGLLSSGGVSAGLLSGRNRPIGAQVRPLMGGIPVAGNAPLMADAEDERMAAAARERLLADQAVLQQMQPEQTGPGRLLAFLGGGTQGLDRRDTQRAARSPAALAARQQVLASITDPRERALYLASPDEWAKNVGQQFAPQVVAGGAAQFIGGRRIGEQPTFTESGDTILERTSEGVNPVYTRTTPSITEQTAISQAETARINALNPINVAPGAQLRAPTGELIAQGADRVFSASDATDLVNEQGQAIYQNQRDAPQVNPEDAAKRRNAAISNVRKIDRTLNTVTQALEQTNGWTAGPLAGLAGVPGTPQADLRGTLETIEANLAFGELNEMRQNSPTGGALGGIAVRELDLLGATIANLKQAQSPEQLRRNLGIVRESLTNLREIYQEQQDAQPPTSSPQGQPAITREAALAEARRRGLIP